MATIANLTEKADGSFEGTLATLTVGAWSDRVGRRREFIAAGYVLWGASTAAFGLIDVHTAALLFPAVNAVVVVFPLLPVMARISEGCGNARTPCTKSSISDTSGTPRAAKAASRGR